MPFAGRIKEQLIRCVECSLVLTLISGCATTGMPGEKVRTIEFSQSSQAKLQSKDANTIALTPEERGEIDAKWNEVLAFCQGTLDRLEGRTTKQAELSVFLTMSGLVAGAIVAPALTAAAAMANRAWISAFSGWAGATNLASQSVAAAGLNGVEVATRRNWIAGEVQKQSLIINDPSKGFGERTDAIRAMQASCVAAPMGIPSPQPNPAPTKPAAN